MRTNFFQRHCATLASKYTKAYGQTNERVCKCSGYFYFILVQFTSFHETHIFLPASIEKKTTDKNSVTLTTVN